MRPNKTLLALPLAAAAVTLNAQDLMLEEIVVTATKRAEGLQDVPIALSVMTGDKITDQGIGSLEDMAVFLPNVHIAEGGAGDQLFIRGIGSGINYSFEQSVGTFIDGVYFGRGQASRSSFLDVARVEVLKGPQSTLFGKNTIAGAINITTARPSDEFEGRVEVTAEPEFGSLGATFMISGPLSDTFGARLVVKRDETDGYMTNTFKNRDERQAENTVARIVLDWVPTDNLDLSLKYENGQTDTIGRQDVLSIATPLAISRYQVADPNFTASFGYDKSSENPVLGRSDDQFHDSEWDIVTLTAEWALGESTLKSVTGYVNYEFENYLDSDYGPLRFLARGREEEHKQFSQEFLLSSATGGSFEYLAGLYYQDEELAHVRETDVLLSAAGLGDGSLDASGPGFFDQDASTISAFVQGTFNLSDSLRLITGLRYSRDEKDFEKAAFITQPFTRTADRGLAILYDTALNFATDHYFVDGQGYRCPGVSADPNLVNFGDSQGCETQAFDTNRSASNVTGDITLQWDASDETMVYFKVGNGYKAFGFDEANGRGLFDAQAYEEETVTAFEMGAKMDLLDGRARMNVAAFFSEFEDVQVSTFDGNAGFVVGNAAESEVFGFEADGSIVLTEQLTLSAAFAYLDATYKSFPDAACNEVQILAFIAEGGARSGCVQDLAGAPLQFSPDYSGNIALDFLTPLTDTIELRINLDAMYSDEYEVAADLDPVLAQDAYVKVNARIQLASVEDTWSVAVLAKNITDERTTTWGNDVPLASQGFSQTYFQHIDPPRTVELQAAYKF